MAYNRYIKQRKREIDILQILLKQDNLSLIKRWNNYYITWIIDENMNWFPAQIKITPKDKEKILTQNEIRPIFDLYLNKNTNFNSMIKR